MNDGPDSVCTFEKRLSPNHPAQATWRLLLERFAARTIVHTNTHANAPHMFNTIGAIVRCAYEHTIVPLLPPATPSAPPGRVHTNVHIYIRNIFARPFGDCDLGVPPHRAKPTSNGDGGGGGDDIGIGIKIE